MIPTKSVPEGVAAILAFNEDASAEDNRKHMISASEDIISAQVTYAVRDTEMNGKKITKGDIIGLSGKEIVSCSKSIEEATLELIDSLINEDISMVTLYVGKDTNKEDSDKLLEKLEEKYSDIDVDLVYGGQPIYYYVISLE